jgi:hypothetical protein
MGTGHGADARLFTVRHDFLKQIKCGRGKRRKDISGVAREIVRHATPHGEADGIDPLCIDTADRFDVLHECLGKPDIIDPIGAARSDVPIAECRRKGHDHAVAVHHRRVR